MGYEEEKEEERLWRKMDIVKEAAREIEKVLDRNVERQKEFEEEKRELRRRGVQSGLDEAIHAISRELAVEVLRRDEGLRVALKGYIEREFRKWIETVPKEA